MQPVHRLQRVTGSPRPRSRLQAVILTSQNTAAISIRRVAGLSRNVGQPDHILVNPISSHQVERRPGSGEIWLAVTQHDGVQVDSILIDQTKFGEALAGLLDVRGALRRGGPDSHGQRWCSAGKLSVVDDS